ncbi:hypothetical protein TGAM01_v210896 [Trichoderma gamsii]|uniref:Uncharacterized protein n=1 Tax=Trichoderma gamsii TaxID=398673 RepID=A0A2P4Z7I9_9HYPO|nr:hypothetical protein TGAM01_v210896 [Trichoderma gamsii]PON20254.1 hypothetical protein TGAM01_v210896 [Trichoderma gamsii]
MEVAIKSKTLSTEGLAESTIESVSHIDKVPIPEKGDSIDVLQRKLTALADAMRHGQSIASMTNYAAATIKERDTIKIATADMPPQEVEAWSLYIDGNYPLPKIDWNDSRDPIPFTKRPLRKADRRAEALTGCTRLTMRNRAMQYGLRGTKLFIFLLSRPWHASNKAVFVL